MQDSDSVGCLIPETTRSRRRFPIRLSIILESSLASLSFIYDHQPPSNSAHTSGPLIQHSHSALSKSYQLLPLSSPCDRSPELVGIALEHSLPELTSREVHHQTDAEDLVCKNQFSLRTSHPPVRS
ncbi:hypothetical protein PM082_000514 [Marasmius tenuissimus]|nr:hypothetical protein PM082_000514 [Marasmius tenuissimus]